MRWVCDGTDRLDWADIKAIIGQSPRTSALARHVNGEAAEWGTTDYLLAELIDVSSVVSWQLGGDPDAKRPAPYPRPEWGSSISPKQPGSGDASSPAGDPFDPNQSGKFEGVPTPIADLNSWLGWDQSESEQSELEHGSGQVMSRNELIVNAYRAGGVTYKSLARQFGVSASTIGRVVRAAR